MLKMVSASPLTYSKTASQRVACAPRHHSGTVIVIALIFLLLTGLISVSAMHTSIFEAKMATNEQLKEEAFQITQGVVNALTTDINYFVVAGDIGYRICATSKSGCNANTIDIDWWSTFNDERLTSAEKSAIALSYDITRKAPLFAPIPFRSHEDAVSSAKAYSAALFEINAEFDGTALRLGHSAIAQGVAIKVANAGQ